MNRVVTILSALFWPFLVALEKLTSCKQNVLMTTNCESLNAEAC